MSQGNTLEKLCSCVRFASESSEEERLTSPRTYPRRTTPLLMSITRPTVHLYDSYPDRRRRVDVLGEDAIAQDAEKRVVLTDGQSAVQSRDSETYRIVRCPLDQLVQKVLAIFFGTLPTLAQEVNMQLVVCSRVKSMSH